MATRSTNILTAFYSSTANALVPLYSPGIVSPSDRTLPARYSGRITSLRAKVAISSIPRTEIPAYDATTTRGERIAALRELEWRSPRKQLDIFMSGTYQGWQPIASISLLNRFPFYTLDLLPLLGGDRTFLVGAESQLAARITATDYGLLLGADTVSIWGTVEESAPAGATKTEIAAADEFEWAVTTSSLVILPPNPNRLQVVLVNQSASETIWLSYGPTATPNRGITLPPGGRHDITPTNLYRGAISAIGSGAAQLVGQEGVSA